MAKAKNRRRRPTPKASGSHVPPHPQPNDPQHGEWVIDEASDESFPASDPSSATQPHPPSPKKGPAT
jgi:hypothetical protein